MIVLPSVSSGVISSSFFDPKKISGLALWLKADAGVSKPSYNYISEIIITGTSNPSFAGTYTADSAPNYDTEEVLIEYYTLSAAGGRLITWNPNSQQFVLSLDEQEFAFSGDGVNWSVISFLGQVIISGFTGIYAGANGTYTRSDEESNFDRVGGGFFIDGEGLKDTSSETLIATAPENYSGSWTPASYVSSVTLSGAGNTSVNGIYTRSETQIDMSEVSYTKSGGGSISYQRGWLVNGDSYVNGFNWQVGDLQNGGLEPAPTNSFATSARSVGSPTSTTVLIPIGSISGVVTTTTVEVVVDWQDQSGNGRSPYVDSENKPTYTIIGGKSFVNLVAGSRLFLSNVIWSDVEFIGTIFFVARFNSSSAGYGSVLFHQEGNTGSLFFIRGIGSTNNFYITKNDGTNVVSSNVLADNNTNYILATTFNASTASLYLNGASAGSGPISSSTGYPVNSSIGYGQSEQFNVAEAIIYNRVLTTSERQQVEAYLNAKYVIY